MTTRSPLFSRRGALQSLAIGAGAAFARPMIPWQPSVAHAARMSGFPARFLFIYVPNGIVYESTEEAEFGQGTDPNDPTKFEWGHITQPLADYKADTVLLDNLELKNSGGDTHISGMQHLATGRQGGGHISPHEYMAQQIGQKVTPQLPILRASVQTQNDTINYGPGGQRITPNQDPYDLFRRTFANLMPGTGAAAPSKDELLARIARRKSVLDHVTRDLTSFRKTLPAEDVLRADAQLDTIRSIEKQLEALATGGVPVCKMPGAPTPGLNHQSGAVADQLVKIQLGTIVSAFACDLTRVASMMFRARESHFFDCQFPEVRSGTVWHGLSHSNYGLFRKARTAFDSWVVEAAVKRLKSIPEGAGTMLDNTIVFVCTEIGRGHYNYGLQFFTVGGKNMGVKTGRFLKLGTKRARGQSESVTNLYVSFLQAMGLNDTKFADASTGPISSYISV